MRALPRSTSRLQTPSSPALSGKVRSGPSPPTLMSPPRASSFSMVNLPLKTEAAATFALKLSAKMADRARVAKRFILAYPPQFQECLVRRDGPPRGHLQVANVSLQIDVPLRCPACPSAAPSRY